MVKIASDFLARKRKKEICLIIRDPLYKKIIEICGVLDCMPDYYIRNVLEIQLNQDLKGGINK